MCNCMLSAAGFASCLLISSRFLVLRQDQSRHGVVLMQETPLSQSYSRVLSIPLFEAPPACPCLGLTARKAEAVRGREGSNVATRGLCWSKASSRTRSCDRQAGSLEVCGLEVEGPDVLSRPSQWMGESPRPSSRGLGLPQQH